LTEILREWDLDFLGLESVVVEGGAWLDGAMGVVGWFVAIAGALVVVVVAGVVVVGVAVVAVGVTEAVVAPETVVL